MALVLRVGTVADIFTEPFAGQLVRVLERHFGTTMHLGGSSEGDGWASIELGYSWLRRLQDHARSLVDPERIPHLLFMPSWRGAFLPIETMTGELSEIAELDEPIAIASLVSLRDELHVLAPAMDVPLEPQACEDLIHRYVSDDDRADDDPEIQTLTQLIIGADLGVSRRHPLWVIK